MRLVSRALRICVALSAAILASLLQTACAPGPDPQQLLTAPQLAELATGHTLRIRFDSGSDVETQLFLAPNGTGWLAEEVRAGYPALPGSISMVLDWRVAEASQLCLWVTPLVGHMPDYVPAHPQCVQVLRSKPPYDALQATVTRNGKSRTGWLEVYAANAFSPPVLEAYLDQVRVLYGGRIPTWLIAAAVRSLPWEPAHD